MADRRLATILGWLREGSRREPPGWIDARILRALRRRAAAGPARPVLRPLAALGLGVLGAGSLTAGLATGLAESARVQAPAELAAILVLAYLAMSATVTLPVLMARRRRRPVLGEAR